MSASCFILLMMLSFVFLEASLQNFRFSRGRYEPEGYTSIQLKTQQRNIYFCAVHCTETADCGGIIFDDSQDFDCTLVVGAQRFIFPTASNSALIYSNYVTTVLLNNDFVQSANTFVVLHEDSSVEWLNSESYCKDLFPTGEVLTLKSGVDATLMKEAFEKKESPGGEFCIGLSDKDVEGEPRWVGDDQPAVLPDTVPFVYHDNKEDDDYCTAKSKDDGFEIKFRRIDEKSSGVFCKVVL